MGNRTPVSRVAGETTTSSQTERAIAKCDFCEAVINDIDSEELKSGQDSNIEAIESVSDWILHLTEVVSYLQENLARNRNNNGKSIGKLHPSQNMNHENTQNNTIVIDRPCASNDPEKSETSDQNNTDIEITSHPNNPSTSIQNLTAKPNNETPILIIGDSIIKNIDPRKISRVNKQLQELCVKNGFDFINNSNMDNTCLNGSQLHINAKGSSFLATNFIKFLRGSNANVKSSYQSHRNGDFRRTQPARLHLLEDLLRLISMPIS